MHPALIISALAALALAAPTPQDIEFDQVDAAPDPIVYTPPSDGGIESVSVLPDTAVIAIADKAVTSEPTTEKRGLLGKRDGDCSATPAGTGPAVTTYASSGSIFLSS